MYTTVEVRWFAPGSPPDILESRFDTLGAPGREARCDAYLHVPGAIELGVKLRGSGDRLEIKLREVEFGETRLAGGPPARLERWQKWSFPVGSNGALPAGLGLAEGSWLEVNKARRMITYRLTGDGAVVWAEQWPEEGCSLELTALTAGGQQWWTVALEAFGDRPVDALLATAEEFFRVPGPAEVLAGSRSCAYPAWLQAEIGESATRP